MQDTEFNHTYTAFISLVNLHLESHYQNPATIEELILVKQWHHYAAKNKSAYLRCVDEIIKKRSEE